MCALIAASAKAINAAVASFLLWSTPLVEEGLKQTSLHERVCMKAFFERAIRQDQAAHVLCFNNKPVCLVATIIKHKNKPYQETLCLKGWKAFKERESLFPHPGFLFNENLVHFGDNLKVLHVYVINKLSVLNCLNKYKSTFDEILGDSFAPDDFMRQLEEGSSLNSLIKNNEMLLGILLGFGEESARAFQRVNGPQKGEAGDDYEAIRVRQPKGCKIDPVAFMGKRDSLEVQQFSAAYEEELRVIWQEYCASRDALRLFLNFLCQDTSK